ncbi:hypothetical protein [Devosia sp. Leaf420]|uniref:hypothetical protein n=1 Tax=Devosia sp. Leaf420 TaxID=1736374 RepID=UPI0012E7C229|nr:hypothetical protein [Devosia sp. Leaf420]
MKRPKIGDVIEIRTRKGLAYAHFSHKHPQYGALLRVFGQTYNARPENFSAHMNAEPTFICFFPLGAAVNRGIVSIAGHVDIPADAREFPIFRAGMPGRDMREGSPWWLWDGEKEWRVGTLSPSQRKLPIRGVWNDTLLIKRIEDGWTPETAA